MQEDLAVERHANEAFRSSSRNGRMRDGRRFACARRPYTPPDIPGGKINATDADSRNVKMSRSYTHGYDAQAVVKEQQIVLAARSPRAHQMSGTSRRRSTRCSPSSTLPA